MSKSIYEETFNHLDELVDVLAHIEGSFLYRHYLDNIRLKLKKAQKQEKLLELYRKLDGCIVAPEGHHVCRYTDNEKYARIRKQIKELENEIYKLQVI